MVNMHQVAKALLTNEYANLENTASLSMIILSKIMINTPTFFTLLNHFLT
jgi:hypothetical protein